MRGSAIAVLVRDERQDEVACRPQDENYSAHGFRPVNPVNAFQAVTIATLATDGVLKLDGVNVIAGQSIAVADISKLTFVADANENGSPYANFTFQVQDDGGTANGGLDLDQSA